MSDEVTAAEVRQWYESRGISVPRRMGKRYVEGWNKAHPDRQYVPFQHGTSTRYSAGCRCRPCTDAIGRRNLAVYHAADFERSGS